MKNTAPRRETAEGGGKEDNNHFLGGGERVLHDCVWSDALDNNHPQQRLVEHMDAYREGFADLTIEATRDKIRQQTHSHLQTLVQFSRRQVIEQQVIVHLASARGAELNGRRCNVVGCDPPSHDDPRVHVQIAAGDVPLRLRQSNLCEAKLYSSEPSKTLMSAKGVQHFAQKAVMCRVAADGSDPRELYVFGQRGRYDLLCSLKPGLEALPAPVKCCDWNVGGCCDGLPEKDRLVAASTNAFKSGCYGDGYVHFERMAENLISPGDLTCTVCLEEIPRGNRIASLPCGHAFHEACAKPALESTHMRCPVCRDEIKGDPTDHLNSFALPAMHRIQLRFCEFIDSGMCERCQMAILEKSQFARVTLTNGSTCFAVDGRVTNKETRPRRFVTSEELEAMRAETQRRES